MRICLGDLYDIERVILDAKLLGWESSRTRQFLIGKLKGLNLSIIEFHPYSSVANVIAEHLTRYCADSFTQKSYMLATDAELVKAKAWALTRPHVLLRRQQENDPTTDAYQFRNDGPDAFQFCLTVRERKHLHDSHGDLIIDLGQSGRPIFADAHGPLFTLVSGMGLIWNSLWGRFYLPHELCLSQGWPITPEHVRASGVMCQWSFGNPTPCPTRTRSSQCKQVGNAMHTNAIGAIIHGIVICYPKLLHLDLEPMDVQAMQAAVASIAAINSTAPLASAPSGHMTASTCYDVNVSATTKRRSSFGSNVAKKRLANRSWVFSIRAD